MTILTHLIEERGKIGRPPGGGHFSILVYKPLLQDDYQH
jgi:hypothetical protein